MISYKEAVAIIRADYEPIARTVVRRLARATKRRPVHPHVIHAIARVEGNRQTRKVINRKARPGNVEGIPRPVESRAEEACPTNQFDFLSPYGL
jgi:hypothetical protein